MAGNFDLVVRAGRVICPATGFDAPAEIAVRAGRIADVSPAVKGESQRILEFADGICLPGLIDLHAHPARSGSIYGVDPDQHVLARGTTTVMSQGDAGAANVDAFVRDTIEQSQTRVVLAINLSSRGEAGPGSCFERLDLADVDACVQAIDRHRAHIWGIAVNASQNCCGATDPREIVRRGLLAAELTGLPVLYGMRRPEDWTLEEQLTLLRPGDVVTYCFRSTPHCIVQNSRVLPAVRDARARGILFDVGHGRASFDFTVAKAALNDGFEPDTISTDLQAGHVGQTPIHDLPLVMSKLRAAGMPEGHVFAAVTSTPAQVLRRQTEIGTLRIGACADLTILRWNGRERPLIDVHGQSRPGGCWEVIATILSGHVVVKLHTPPLSKGG